MGALNAKRLLRVAGGLFHGDAAPGARYRRLPGTVANHAVAGRTVEKRGFRDPREFMNEGPHDAISAEQLLLNYLRINEPPRLCVSRPQPRASRKATAQRPSIRDQPDNRERPPRQPYAHRT
jgi:hypothetical protein